jgi:hypothetical protein
MFKLCQSLSSKLRNYSMRTGSWLLALAATTNQPFWDALWACAHPHKLTLLASSFGAKISLNPHLGIRFWFGLTQKCSICPCHLTTPLLSYSLCLWCNFLEVLKLSLHFTCNLMWYIYVIFRPIKRKVMSSSRSTFPLPLYRSIMEFFYGFLGMFHVRLIHPICLYWMVSFPLD